MRIVVASLLVLIIAGSAPADPPTSQPSGILVQAKVVRGASEGPASQPEDWVIDAVRAVPVNRQAGMRPPLFVEAVMGWLPISLDKPTTFDVRGMRVTTTVRREGQSLTIGLGLESGNARAESQLVLDAAPGSRNAMQVSSNLDGQKGYLVVRVLAAQSAATTRPDVANLIFDLSDDDGQVRLAATKAIFALGKDAIEPLQKCGAKQVSPFGSIITRRIDMVYSLLDGLKPNQPARGPKDASGYLLDGFGIRVEKGVTGEDVAKMGEKYGFVISGKFRADSRPQCIVNLKPGKNLADVLKAILLDEPKVISVNLIYYVS